MGKKLMTVQSLATQTLRDSTDAYNQALNILQQAKSLEVPEVDHATLEDQAVKVERDARRIQEEAQRLISENEELLRAAQGPNSVHLALNRKYMKIVLKLIQKL